MIKVIHEKELSSFKEELPLKRKRPPAEGGSAC